MWFSWRNLKISIAGAKLSHLVRKDKIWDHGTMIETVKIIFNHVKKARSDGDVEMLRKYMTTAGCQKFEKEIEQMRSNGKGWLKSLVIKDVGIIEVMPGKHNKPDHFTAVVDEISQINADEFPEKSKNKFSEHWSFVRQGEWWMLDEIRL
jgi:predicted lipid-binding transport protein (Tim44 family)